jgi:hypothetical protein
MSTYTMAVETGMYRNIEDVFNGDFETLCDFGNAFMARR